MNYNTTTSLLQYSGITDCLIRPGQRVLFVLMRTGV